jgi:acetyl-CoA carboxylase carboxyl transferase subunit beta
LNWLRDFVRPKIRALVKKDVPDDLWHKCPGCEQMIFHRDLTANLRVCPQCGHHLRMGAKDRLAMLFDGGAYQRIELPKTIQDPLKFKDTKKYVDRLKDYRARTKEHDMVIVAHGKIAGIDTVVAVFDFAFMGGSMGVAAGEALVAAAQLAVLQESPLITIPASGGARMQEGILSLMQLPRSIIAVQEVKEAGLPYIVILADPTTGGVSASFAMLGDIQISEPGATIGFAGRRVIEETMREKLPADFQTAEYLYEHGMLDMVVPRKELRSRVARILNLLIHKSPKAEVVEMNNSA